jgi:hypothetical protein
MKNQAPRQVEAGTTEVRQKRGMASGGRADWDTSDRECGRRPGIFRQDGHDGRDEELFGFVAPNASHLSAKAESIL